MTQKVVKPIALDESFRTTEQNPQNIADVLANKLDAIKSAIENGGSDEMEAAFECHYNVTSATDIYNAMQEKKVPFFYQNGVVAQLWKVETNKYTFRTTSTRVVEGENILDIVDYIVNGSVWSTATKTISGGSSSQQAYLAKVESSVNFDTTGLSGMQSIISVNDVPADGVYQLSIFMCITPKTASATKSDLVFQFTGTSGTGMPNTTFHAVVDDSQTFGQQLSFSTTLNLKAGTNTLKMSCGGLNTEYLVFVDNLTVAQLVNGVYHNGDDFEDVHTLPEIPDFNNDDGVLVDGATGGPRFMMWQTLANKVLGFIKSLSTTITAFRSGDVIPVDGPSGTAKMDASLIETCRGVNEKILFSSATDVKSVFPYVSLKEGKYLDENGVEQTNILTCCTDFIEVPPCNCVRVLNQYSIDENTHYAFLNNYIVFVYDADKNLISKYGKSNIQGDYKAFISNGKYIRVNASGTGFDNPYIIFFGEKEQDNNFFLSLNLTIGKFIASDGSESIGYAHTDYVSVPDFSTAVNVLNRITIGANTYKFTPLMAQYDKDKNLICVNDGNSYDKGAVSVNLERDTKFVRLNFNPADVDFPDLLLQFVTETPEIIYKLNVTASDIDGNELLDVYALSQKTNGQYVDDTGALQNQGGLSVTDYIDVSNILSVTLNNKVGNSAFTCKGAMYDSNKSFVAPIVSSYVGLINAVIPKEVAFIRVNLYNSNDYECCIAKSRVTKVNSLPSKWQGKKAVFLGDSITEGLLSANNPMPFPYPKILESLLNLSSSVNYGLGGSKIGGTSADSFISRYPSMDDDADLVCVMGGTNDALYGSLPLGVDTDTSNTTFYGALYVLMNGLKNKYPYASIVFMTPLHYNDSNGTPSHGEHVTDAQMDEWAEAIVVQGKRCGVPVIDFRNLSGLNPNVSTIRTKFFSDTWIHPNQEGALLMSTRIFRNFELV